MNLPYFYKEHILGSDAVLVFEEENSRHIVQVLRMQKGELLLVTDGKGQLLKGEIINDHKKKCEVKIVSSDFHARSQRKISIAISLLKNSSRFEWFLEKVTEIGVQQIIPLICERTEKQHFRQDRFKTICTSAMLQSQQTWLPDLQQPLPFRSLFNNFQYEQKFIAHCMQHEKQGLSKYLNNTSDSAIILIGPEGDFTSDEIALAIQNSCVPVSLGETRLRTETAGIVSASILALH